MTTGRQRGFALLTVLAAMLLLVWLAGSIGRISQTELAMAQAQTVRVQAEAAADGAVWIALTGLDRAARPGVAPAYPAAQTVEIAGVSVRLLWADQANWTDIHNATPESLLALATTVTDQPEAEQFVARVLAQRAEAATGLSWRIPRRAFPSETALRAVATEALFDQIKDRVRVHELPDPTSPSRLVTVVAQASDGDGNLRASRRVSAIIGGGVRILEWTTRP